jgi:hypothetical protein
MPSSNPMIESGVSVVGLMSRYLLVGAKKSHLGRFPASDEHATLSRAATAHITRSG